MALLRPNKQLKIGVIGAGNMGSGIAQKYASAGLFVIAIDQNSQILNNAKASIHSMLDEALRKGIYQKEDADRIRANLHFGLSLADAADCDLIIEAIFEQQEAKIALFADLEKHVSPSAVLASNTSSFLLSDCAEKVKRKQRFLGLHYFYHPAKNRLVEIIPIKETSLETINWVKKLQERMGKIPLVVKDSPGFVVNRFFVPWLNESMRIVYEGVANMATVEACLKRTFGISMGPFQLMNVTGLPITYHACQSLAAHLGPFYAPCPMIEPMVTQKETFCETGEIDEKKFTQIKERMLAVVGSVAHQLVFREQVGTVLDVELGAKIGLRWKKGPFELINDAGLGHLRNALELRHENLLKEPLIKEFHARLGEAQEFGIPLVTSKIEDRVGIIFLQRHDALNALNPKLVDQMRQAFLSFLDDPEVLGIVFVGGKKAFIAGADLDLFQTHLKSNDLDAITKFAKETQDLFSLIDASPKPVASVIEGITLGGGFEFTLACDVVVAGSQASFAFPETGIGIYPGLGGTQRLPRKIGVPLARWLILSGAKLNAEDACNLGLVQKIANDDELLAKAKEAVLDASFEGSGIQQSLFLGAFGDVHEMFQKELFELFQKPPENLTKRAHKAWVQLGKKAPLALKAADELIRISSEISLSEGLYRELQGIKNIFATSDARAAICQSHSGQPVFVGK